MAEASTSREISTIAFPYNDLEDTINTARAMHAAGGIPMDRDQLAAALGIVPSGGNFALKLSAARMFGLIEPQQNKYVLTDLGFEILDPSRERASKAKAFLNVPLYKRTYDEFKGRQLPPRPLGLETAFVQFGVTPKQKDKARHAFERSARSAGFFPNASEDRLVQPLIGTPSKLEEPSSPIGPDHYHPPAGPTFAPSVQPPQRDGVITALIDKLPNEGSPFPMAERKKWLTMMEMAMEMAYGTAGPTE